MVKREYVDLTGCSSDEITSMVEAGLIPANIAKSYFDKCAREVLRINPEYDPDKPRPTLEWASGTMEVVLGSTTYVCPNQSMIEVAQKLGKDDQWVAEVKNLKVPRITKEAYTRNKDHPGMKDLKKTESVDVNSISSSDTVNKQTRRLCKAKNSHLRFLQLEERLAMVEAEHDITKERINASNLMEDLTDKEKMYAMFKRGVKQEKIAEYFQVSLSTVKRAVREQKSLEGK